MKLDRSKIVLQVIERNPGIRFNEIMRITDIRNGTLSHYVKKLETNGEIELERTPRVTRAYPAGIPTSEAIICKFLTIPTQKKNNSIFARKKRLPHQLRLESFF